MGSVTAFTAARSKAIEDNAFVSARVDAVGEARNLILIKKNDVEVNVGDIRGPQGIQGLEGSVSTAELNAAIAAQAALEAGFRATAINDSGRGIVSRAVLGSEFSWNSIEDVPAESFIDVFSCPTTFPADAEDRIYALAASASIKTDGVSGGRFHIQITDSAGTTFYGRDTTTCEQQGHSAGLNIYTTIEAPASWNSSSKTFKLRARSSVGDNTYVIGDVIPATLQVIDLGTI